MSWFNDLFIEEAESALARNNAGLYVCSDGEYTVDGTPTIAEPKQDTTYLVPQDAEGTVYASWAYVDGAWQFVEMLTVSLDETEGGSGKDGLSAYEVAVKNGFGGTEQEWLESLKGKQGLTGETGPSLAPDWNQNDSTTKDYIKNRPFFDSRVWKTVFEEQEVEFSKYGDHSKAVFDIPVDIFNGDYPGGTICEVKIDDETYIGAMCPVTDNSLYYLGYPALNGDGWTVYYKTGPYCVHGYGDGIATFDTKKPAGIYKVSISVLVSGEIKKIDPKYMPDPEPCRVLLWENPHPDEEFGGQRISLPILNEYDGVEIVYGKTELVTSDEYYSSLDVSEYGARKSTGFIPLNDIIALEQTYITGSYSTEKHHAIVRRYVHYRSEKELYITDTFLTTHGSVDEPYLNGACVPFYIYGIKNGSVTSSGSSDSSGSSGAYILRPTAEEINLDEGVDMASITIDADDMLRAVDRGKVIYIEFPDVPGRFTVTSIRRYYSNYVMSIPGIDGTNEYNSKSYWWIVNTGAYVPDFMK